MSEPTSRPTLPLGTLRTIISRQPYPLVFATVSGAHLYGFASADSDFDLRGCHVLPVAEVVGLEVHHETLESSRVDEGLELDLVTHDARKFFGLLLKKNGYVLEQVLSPLVVHTSAEHEELKSLARSCVTRNHSHHYLGFARTQWKLFEREQPPRVKPLLYVYRVLLTGIHLMQTGEIEANLPRLNETQRLPYLDDLIARKMAGSEAETMTGVDVEFHRREFDRLQDALDEAHRASRLPESPAGRRGLNDLLVRLRLHGMPAGPSS